MIDIEKVLLSLDLTLVAQRGVEVQGMCPMHKKRTGNEDHNPSWWINSKTGVHICFSCNYKGNIYTLVSDLNEIDYYDAKDYVEGQTELPVDGLVKRMRELPQYVTFEEPITMSESKLALFVEPPDIELKKRFLTRESVKKYGVLWDLNNSSWILPIRDPLDYKLWGWQEKSARGRFFKNQPIGVRKSKSVFGVDVMSVSTLVVVESPLDAVRLDSCGFPGAISTYGASPSEEQAKIMRRASRVLAAFDKDDAGLAASEQMRLYAKKYGIDLLFFNYTGISSKDPGDMTTKELTQGMESARDMIYGKKAYSWT